MLLQSAQWKVTLFSLFCCQALVEGSVISDLYPDCLIEDITIQSFFAIDGFYEKGDDRGASGKEIVRNKIMFMTDVKGFLYTMEQLNKGVDSYNGIFTFGESIKLLQNFTDDTLGTLEMDQIMTERGDKTVVDALEEIIDEFEDIPIPKTDYVRLGILVTSRPLYSTTETDEMGAYEIKETERLSSMLSKIKDEKIIMYAIGKDSNKADMIKIAGSEQRIILNNFTDSYGTDMETLDKFRTVLCKSINDNRIALVAITIGAGAIVGIVIAVIAALVIGYVIKKHAYDKYQLKKLAEAKENMKNKSEENRLYEDPVRVRPRPEMPSNSLY